MTVDELNALPADAAIREFLRSCGSTRWARAMEAARPFATIEVAVATADRIWSALAPGDWLEAFAAHPRIGERQPGPSAQSGSAGAARSWSEEEQAGVERASAQLRDRLAAANRDYEARFGYIFIVCATAKTADEMLALLEERLANRPSDELRLAAEEQRKITSLRLSKLLTRPRASA
jgi:OHCU decarboxylase